MVQYEIKEVLGPEDFMRRGMSCPRKPRLSGSCKHLESQRDKGCRGRQGLGREGVGSS